MLNALIFDVEIKNCVPPPFFKPDLLSEISIGQQFYNYQTNFFAEKKGVWSEKYYNEKYTQWINGAINPLTNAPYQYCAGWEDYENMGVGVVGVWDLVENEFLTFFDDPRLGQDLDELQELIYARDFLIGYNNKKFDNSILKTYGLELKPSFDLLRSLWRSSNLNPDEFTSNHKGYGLDQLSAVNTGDRKNKGGEEAPKLFQRGEIGKLIRYNTRDVMLLRKMFLRALDGALVHPISGEKVRLEVKLEY